MPGSCLGTRICLVDWGGQVAPVQTRGVTVRARCQAGLAIARPPHMATLGPGLGGAPAFCLLMHLYASPPPVGFKQLLQPPPKAGAVQTAMAAPASLPSVCLGLGSCPLKL